MPQSHGRDAQPVFNPPTRLAICRALSVEMTGPRTRPLRVPLLAGRITRSAKYRRLATTDCGWGRRGARALSTAEASALLPLAAQHRKDLCKPAVLGFVLKRVVVLGDLVCHLVGRPHLTDEPRAARADREMEADPERVPRGQLPVDERARAVRDIPAGQHFRSVLSTTSRERDPRGSFSLRSAERLLRKISLRRCHISPARAARDAEARAYCPR